VTERKEVCNRFAFSNACLAGTTKQVGKEASFPTCFVLDY
jgi:hypothetical protein